MSEAICNNPMSVLIDSSGCDLFRTLCLPKQSVNHSLPSLWKCNYLRDRGHPYKLPDLWPLNSPDLNPVNVIQQRVHRTKVQDVIELIQSLIDVWAAVEDGVITGRLLWPPAGIKFTHCVSGQKSEFSHLQEKLCVGSKNDWHRLELSRRSLSACKVWGRSNCVRWL